MRRTLSFAGISVIVIFLLALAFKPVTASVSAKTTEGNPEFPDSVLKIVQKACFDCHGNDGNGMAKAHVNMGKWNTYDVKKQASKAGDMAKKLDKGAMPPDKWRKSNPDNVPTPAEVNTIKNWAAALKK
jgi:hypothetical protein